MTEKSKTCFGKATGKGLSVYYSQEEAQESANYINNTYERDLMPYHCHICNLWHLSPANRITPSRNKKCCTDSNGNFKVLYDSKASAKRRAAILYQEEGHYLSVYSCPEENGWHLTSS